jgi:hypothetical protein
MKLTVQWFFLGWAVWTAGVGWHFGLDPSRGIGLLSMFLIVLFLWIARPRHAQ